MKLQHHKSNHGAKNKQEIRVFMFVRDLKYFYCHSKTAIIYFLF